MISYFSFHIQLLSFLFLYHGFAAQKLVDLFNPDDTCLGACVSTDDFCRSDCIDFCFSRCPNRLSFPPAPSHHTFPKRFLAAALVLGITVISLICLTIYYKFYSGPCIRRRRAEENGRNQISEEFIDQDHGPVLDHPIWYINTVGLQPSVINSINVCKYRKGDGLVEGTDCSVCLCEFQEDETLRLLPKCSHAFHIPCIDTWLRSHTNCPLCRSPIVAPNQKPQASSTVGAGGGEETRIGVSERREESAESGDGEMRIQIEERDDSDLQEEDRRRKRREAEVGIQPLRRSISLYSLSAFKISQALAGDHLTDRDSVKESESSAEIAAKRIGSNQGLIRFMASSSIGRSLQIGPSSLKRSFSCGGKLFLQRHSSSSTVLPL